MSVSISVIVATHNPDPGRLHRTLAGLAAQTLDRNRWELLLVDNASDSGWIVPEPHAGAFPAFRLVREPVVGLTAARTRGIREARGDVLVFVDDDNVLDPDYVGTVARLFAADPRLAAAGGRLEPEWEAGPPDWTREFHALLALRDLGPEERLCRGGPGVRWPGFAPVGAGMAVRRGGALAYADALDRDPVRRALDRTGRTLGSGGDSDLVFTLLHAGGTIGYFPSLRLTHLIPARRLEASYLARLNAGIMRTWVVVLHLHGQCPWPPVRRWTVPVRCARAWVRTRAWRSPAAFVRWRGRCGQFSGQAALDGLIRQGGRP